MVLSLHMADKALDEVQVAPEGLFSAEGVTDKDPQTYEVGYHLLPTLSEDEAQAATKDLMNFLKKEGATAVGDKAPVKIDLAYAIEKRIAGKLTDFSTAYFGWVAFEVPPKNIETVKKFMDTNPSVLRYLMISTTKAEVTAVLEGAVIMPTAQASTEAIAAPKRATEDGAVVSDEALSKALDTMADEDAGKDA